MVSGKLANKQASTKANALVKPNTNIKPKYRNERQGELLYLIIFDWNINFSVKYI